MSGTWHEAAGHPIVTIECKSCDKVTVDHAWRIATVQMSLFSSHDSEQRPSSKQSHLQNRSASGTMSDLAIHHHPNGFVQRDMYSLDLLGTLGARFHQLKLGSTKQLGGRGERCRQRIDPTQMA